MLCYMHTMDGSIKIIGSDKMCLAFRIPSFNHISCTIHHISCTIQMYILIWNCFRRVTVPITYIHIQVGFLNLRSKRILVRAVPYTYLNSIKFQCWLFLKSCAQHLNSIKFQYWLFLESSSFIYDLHICEEI